MEPSDPSRAPRSSPRPSDVRLQAALGKRRVAIEGVTPEIDCGRFPVKRTVGERMVVEADAFADGHDVVAALLLHRLGAEGRWEETPMQALGNDRWRGEFTVGSLGRYAYTVEAWVDPFQTWVRDLRLRVKAGQDVEEDLRIGAELVAAAAARAGKGDAGVLAGLARKLAGGGDRAERLRLALDRELADLVDRHPERRFATRYARELAVVVERERARSGAWYEMFPRSAAAEPGRHGTFADVVARLPYVAGMGFDVLYLPPIHPIGRTHRKGKNNAPVPAAGDVGSPWAIGGGEGGHTAIHPDLGTREDFRALVAAVAEHGLEIALDLAYQCSPDHPWVEEHPEWFRRRPDGSIQYAENPPKKYEDIYPLDFETEDWQELWRGLKRVVDFWIGEGVKIFRVDNPHTKAFPFWEWLIAEVREAHPEAIFLSEAFTRPKVMYRLAKLGFSQSYNYFPWRNGKGELIEYFSEITRPPVVEFFRANLWPNTPDILTEVLQFGGRPAFAARLLLAATLGASYGIYGPAFELAERQAREPGSEEYRDSEKYQLRHWDVERADSLAELIGRVNRIRRANPALLADRRLAFHPVDNDQLLCYSKVTENSDNVIVVVVNLDPHHVQSGVVDLRLDELGLASGEPFQVHDLLTDARYLWRGARNFVRLDPARVPGHILRLRHKVRSEEDFDYYL